MVRAFQWQRMETSSCAATGGPGFREKPHSDLSFVSGGSGFMYSSTHLEVFHAAAL